ncbi:hypothetical protein DPMN_171105 [Dreissena polymorpha]|uniref:Uncharacterized protein n=1 Tax=Dreissena polymorpha TaxID=45954 RepID=A0A9D4DZ50_DREPO|nr:hypothetical protein DPMN_171105 [Dreissena polymorpha]
MRRMEKGAPRCTGPRGLGTHPQLAAMFSYHLKFHTSPICQLPIVLNASSFDDWCNTSFDWTRKEKQRMDGTDTEGFEPNPESGMNHKCNFKVLTRINSLLSGGNIFQQTRTIFEHIQDIIRTNVLTKFQPKKENCPPPGGHVFQPTGTGTCQRYHWEKSSDNKTRKNAPPPGGHVFQPTGAIFKLIHDVIGTNLLTKLHEDQQINVASRVLKSIELIQDIIVTNLLTKFHEAQTINVASRVLTRKNALSPGGHIFQATRNIFELVQYIMGSNLLTKFNDDRTINEASKETNAPPPGSHFDEDRTINVASKSVNKAAQKRGTKGNHKSSP